MRTKPSVPPRMAYTPEAVEQYLAEDELKLYRLIWMRFVASPDDARGVRSDHHRRRAPRARTASTTCSAPPGRVPKFDGFLKVYEEGKDQKDEEDEELKHKLPAGDRGRDAEASRRSSRSSTSPSRRRASTKRRWSRNWKPTASAGRPPTRPSSPPFRSASTSRRKAASSRPPSSAWW